VQGSVATLRVVGEKFAEDQAIELAADWNLVSFLPRQPPTVQDALQSIDGQYTAVLGYDQGALSYYPDIDPSFNTLHEMEPLFGYWIKMIQAGTLQYPTTGGDQILDTPSPQPPISNTQYPRSGTCGGCDAHLHLGELLRHSTRIGQDTVACRGHGTDDGPRRRGVRGHGGHP